MFRTLEEWIRHRLRAVRLKHWGSGHDDVLGVESDGASGEDARKVAANSQFWWYNSRMRLSRAMPSAYFDQLGMPRLS